MLSAQGDREGGAAWTVESMYRQVARRLTAEVERDLISERTREGLGGRWRQGDQYGWAVDYETAAAAWAAALRECGPGCSVVLTFERCAAYAADQDSDSTATGWPRGRPLAGPHRGPETCRNRRRTCRH